MIEQNHPKGLLPLTVHYINKRTEFWYDITEMQSLSVGKVSEWKPPEVQQRIYEIQTICLEMEQYLLSPAYLCLNPEQIYLGDQETLCFGYAPEANSSCQEQMINLIWFLISHMNHEETIQTAELYCLYHKLQKEKLGPKEILQQIEKYRPKHSELNQSEKSAAPVYVEEKEERKERYLPVMLKGRHKAGRLTEHLFGRWRSQKKKETTWIEPYQEFEAAQSHCFLRSCGEMILETSELNQSPFLIGSSRSECNLWLIDPAVSRIHARLLYEKGRWYIMDAGSVNGTKCNHVPVRKGERKELQPGDQLDFAGVVYVFDRIERPDGIRLDNPDYNE